MSFKPRVGITVAVAILVSAVIALSQGAKPPKQDQELQTPARSPELGKYLLGPGDEIVILAVDADEIANKPLRIPTGGDINLPMVGRIHAAGLTV